MATFSNFSNHKKMQKYTCEICDFSCSNKYNYGKHIETEKHKMAFLSTLATNQSSEKCKMGEKNAKLYQCEICQKSYKDKTGLWRHKKKCGMQNNVVMTQSPTENAVNKMSDSNGEKDHLGTMINEKIADSQDDKDLIRMLVKQNNELITVINKQHTQTLDIMAKGTGDTNNSHNNINQNNSHNKTFNLQFFLNETCKDAMNITDFVNSLKLSLQDLEKVGELGYAEGISQMFVKGLSEMEVTKRPIHCSDLKRETLHIKDQDTWEKDNANQDKLKKVIKDLSNKNIMLLDDWKQENPGCTEYDNQKNDIYLKMMIESMGPADKAAERKDFGKIIRSIAKNTIIEKDLREYQQHSEV